MRASSSSRKNRRNPKPCPASRTWRSPRWASTSSTPKFLIEELVRDAARSDSNHDFGKDIISGAIGRLPVLAYSFQDMRRHRPGLLARRRHGRCVLAGQHRADRSRAGAQPLRHRLADLDLPGAAAAGQVRVRRPRPSRDRGQLDGLGRLHHRRLYAQALAGLLQRDHRDPFAGRRVGLAAQCAGRAQLQDPPRNHRQGMPDPRATVIGFDREYDLEALPRLSWPASCWLRRKCSGRHLHTGE